MHHKIQNAIAMEQRARVMGKTAEKKSIDHSLIL